MLKVYSIGCPSCKVLERKLQQENIDFELITAKDEIYQVAEQVGIASLPFTIDQDNQVRNFRDSLAYLNTLKGENK